MFGGSITALVTPFAGDGLDERTFADLVDWQVMAGTNGLVACSTTGEGPTLTPAERDRLVRLVRLGVECAARRVPVIAATGTNCTATTIALTHQARLAGADAALVTTPFYNRPSQDGLYRHFEAVARAVDLPILVHNAPARTGVDLLPGTIGRLAAIASIVGLCDQSRDPLRPRATARVAGEGFVQLCGEDGQALAFNAAGGHGCISVLANVLPRPCADLQRACRDGRYDMARDIHSRLSPFIEALEGESDPVPIKIAMSLTRPGFERSWRLPLVGASARTRHAIEAEWDLVSADRSWTGTADTARRAASPVRKRF